MSYSKPINFMKFPLLYFVISLCILVPGTYSLLKYGLKPAIDFTGGSLVELQASQGAQLNPDVIRQHIPSEIQVVNVSQTNSNNLLLQMKPITKEQNEVLKQKLASVSGQLDELRFETTGPVLGSELLQKTLVAIIISASLILLYVAYRFKSAKYGVSAILAMFHDSLVILGTFSLLGHFYGVEVDTLFVTALLTILSFSVHDTIVVYDRIRESLKVFPKANFYDLINKAVNETLARSINNSMTIIFMLLALWLLGGETTKWFVFALLVGTVTGTYSSTFTAAPILVVWEKLQRKKK